MAAFCVVNPACAPAPDYDLVIRGGTLYDGSGDPGLLVDLAISGDTIVAKGDLAGATGRNEIDATGMAVAPGFVNLMSWATETMIEDGRAMSDILQGVTLQVMGEGSSMGPIPDSLKDWARGQQGDIKYEIEWSTLGEYLEYLVDRGVSPNVASFMGAATARVNVLGFEDRAPSPEELTEMQEQVRQAMREGALGVASALIYAPGAYAETSELIALAEAAGEFGGIYISHLRSEGNRLLEAFDEFLTIAREAGVPAEIYHLKAAGEENWSKMDEVIRRVEEAQGQGMRITADMYTYTAGATGLDAAMPPWAQEGGPEEWYARLRDPDLRARIAQEIITPTDEWENLLLAAGGAENVLLVGFKQDSLKYLTGKTLAEASEMRGTPPEITAMDLVSLDESRVGTVYFIMSEENVKKKIALPWVSFCSDAGAPAAEGIFLDSNPHPRAYGSFARLLGRYVREEQVIPLPEAVRRLAAFPAENLGIRRRGRLEEGYFADVVVFDPARIVDNATFAEPHQYATGVAHVFVNGIQVVSDGEHTGAKPGKVVRGPGWIGWD
ncbi:MAG: D-aminoacylase [Gemmatimonadetes bacterium]|nr:D-aminoacylase [Gemmatimonadota bacterium]NNM04894.1 D-aminoacylase [Gemmatimonadota bacterium]